MLKGTICLMCFNVFRKGISEILQELLQNAMIIVSAALILVSAHVSPASNIGVILHKWPSVATVTVNKMCLILDQVYVIYKVNIKGIDQLIRLLLELAMPVCIWVLYCLC